MHSALSLLNASLNCVFLHLVWSSRARLQAIRFDSHFLRIQVNSELWKCFRENAIQYALTHNTWDGGRKEKCGAEDENQNNISKFQVLVLRSTVHENYWISFSWRSLRMMVLNPNEWVLLRGNCVWSAYCVLRIAWKLNIWNWMIRFWKVLLEFTSRLTSFHSAHSVLCTVYIEHI